MKKDLFYNVAAYGNTDKDRQELKIRVTHREDKKIFKISKLTPNSAIIILNLML